jgi:hypothetical protein
MAGRFQLGKVRCADSSVTARVVRATVLAIGNAVAIAVAIHAVPNAITVAITIPDIISVSDTPR